MTKRILVTGKNGQLGQSLQKITQSQPDFTFHFVGRDELDLTNNGNIKTFFDQLDSEYDGIINCAAYTAVDKAESENDLADQINHLAVKTLAEIAHQKKIPLIHVSTDYVFNGKHFQPYTENQSVEPINVYGATKLLGEQAIAASGCSGAIIRTSWVYSEFGNNFVKTMLRLGKERDNLNVIFDQIGTPTYAEDLAYAILKVIETDPQDMQLYHFSNDGVCSWFDFAKAIFELAKVDCELNAIEGKDYPTTAVRPYYSVMNKAKIKNQLNAAVPYWRDSLKKCLKELEVKQ